MPIRKAAYAACLRASRPRASFRTASTSAAPSTIILRQDLKTISIRPGGGAATAKTGSVPAPIVRASSRRSAAGVTSIGMKPGGAALGSTSRARRQPSNCECTIPCRRAVAEICRGPGMLSNTIRSFSPSLQRRRLPVSTTSRRCKTLLVSLSILTVINDLHRPTQDGPSRTRTSTLRLYRARSVFPHACMQALPRKRGLPGMPLASGRRQGKLRRGWLANRTAEIISFQPRPCPLRSSRQLGVASRHAGR